MSASSPSVERVRAALQQLGIASEVHELPASTRTAQDAANALGCEVAQIAKSIVFRGAQSNRPILVVACGAGQIAPAKVAAQVGEEIAKADANFVRERTGFAIGGVPPVSHGDDVVVILDRELLGFSSVWAAAGTPHAVFAVNPRELAPIAHHVAEIKAES
jgi:prolyl-tRNA editing enzyme YbaK/EbsC (Cys-tRNA(Pro) deacylase)